MKNKYKCKKSQMFAVQNKYTMCTETHATKVGEIVTISDDHTKLMFDSSGYTFNLTPEQFNDLFEPYITKEEQLYLRDMRDKCIIAAIQGLVAVEANSDFAATRAIGYADSVIEKLKQEMI